MLQAGFKIQTLAVWSSDPVIRCGLSPPLKYSTQLTPFWWASRVKLGSGEPKFQICTTHDPIILSFTLKKVTKWQGGSWHKTRILIWIQYWPTGPPYYIVSTTLGTILQQNQYLDCAVQWSTGKGVVILWVESHLHNIMGVPFKDLSASPAFVPIPELYKHVIWWGKHIWKCRVNWYTTDIICVSLKLLHFVHCVVIVHPDEHVIWTGHNPLLARYELCRSHWKLKQSAKVSPEDKHSSLCTWISEFWRFVQGYQTVACNLTTKHLTENVTTTN